MRGDTPYSVYWIDSAAEKSKPDGIPVTCFSSAKDANAAIENPENNIAAIFVNPVLPTPGGLHMISHIHRVRPATPVFLIYEGKNPFSRTELLRMGVVDAIPKSEASQKAKSLISPEIFKTAPKRIAYPAKQEPGYIAVPANDFLSGTPSFYDVFVRLPSSKFLKIVEAKDGFAPSRVLAYLEKGVTHFHLKTETHSRCLSYCDGLAGYLLTHDDISLEMKAIETMNRGQELIETVRKQGLGSAQMDFAASFIGNTHYLVKSIDLDGNADLNALMKHSPAYEHAVLTTLIAGLMSLPLKIESKSTFRTLGLAALFHDVGLYQMPAEVQHENQAKMSEAQLALYRTHPIVGAKILKNIPGLEDATVQAVAQHHERRDNQGFPRQAKATEINRIAEIIGMSSEYAHLVIRKASEPELNPLAAMEEKIFPGYTLPVVDAFRTVFMDGAQAR